MFFFFFNDTATTEIYTLSLHDALPIFVKVLAIDRGPGQVLRDEARAVALDERAQLAQVAARGTIRRAQREADRKSTRLNSSHANISYAVFCLKKKRSTPSMLLPLTNEY